MKKYIILAMMVVIAILYSIPASAVNVELSGAVNYSKNTSGDKDEYSRERVRVAHIVKLDEKWDGLYGVEYQFKDSTNERAIIPQAGFRYYPTDVVALHLGSTIGGHIETHEGFDIKPTIEANIGLGKRELMLEAFTGFDDEKDFCAGVRAGYIFNF